MKKMAFTSLLAVFTGFAGTPLPAKAGHDTALAVIGGFIGGVLVASAAHDHHDSRHTYCEYDECNDRYVVGHRHYAPHREAVTVRVWVPGRWVIGYNDRGYRTRYYERGRYEYRTEYVIVERPRGRARGYGG